MPARSSAWGIYETFATKSGEKLFIGITSDNHWRGFCTAFSRPDLLADPRFASNAARVENRPALREIVAAIAAERDIAALARTMEQAGIPFSPVNRPSDLFDDPQAQAHALPIRMPTGTTAGLPPLPIAFDDGPPPLRLQPPEAGEHTDAILAGLGYPQDRIAALRAADAVR